jgi:hypothetical protein
MFLDMDVFIIDFNRKLESIIQFAENNSNNYNNNNSNNYNNKDIVNNNYNINKDNDNKDNNNNVCEIIVQDGPVSLNTGILITRVSPQGNQFLP